MPNQPAEAIEPCPWCDSELVTALEVIHNALRSCAVRCAACGATGPATKDFISAGPEWDRVAKIVRKSKEPNVKVIQSSDTMMSIQDSRPNVPRNSGDRNDADLR